MSAGDHADDAMSARAHPIPTPPRASGGGLPMRALLTGPRARGGVLR